MQSNDMVKETVFEKEMQIKELDKTFPLPGGGRLHAVDKVSFDLRKGSFLGLVGESGCGKSTIAKLLVGLLQRDAGEIIVGDKEVKKFDREYYKKVQMIFQMPLDSFNPRQRLGDCLTTVQTNFGIEKEAARARIPELLDMVRLPENYARKYPVRMSGGECQRAAIARALAIEPDVLICDEITSALDVSVQAQVVELLQDLQKDRNLSVIFITHDLALAGGLCKDILVMESGKIVERGKASEVLGNPRQEYTKRLIDAILM